jgi:hypothetical protein
VIEIKRFSLVKPTLQTKFHIDFDWWGQNDNDWRVHLRSLLCATHQQAFSEAAGDEMIDWVDLETAEVQRVNGLRNALISHCAKQEGFITDHTTMVDAVFRVFLANGNVPLTPVDLAERLGRPPEMILRTLSGGHVYLGLRPCLG